MGATEHVGTLTTTVDVEAENASAGWSTAHHRGTAAFVADDPSCEGHVAFSFHVADDTVDRGVMTLACDEGTVVGLHLGEVVPAWASGTWELGGAGFGVRTG